MGRYSHSFAPYAKPVSVDNRAMLWDIFCKVIDNFGDIGVCWRLCADLSDRGQQVRLWVDDASALDWMAPGARQGQWPDIEVYPWAECSNLKTLNQLPRADVWIEGFGCEIAPEFIAHYAQSVGLNDKSSPQSLVWINLEYLSAEAYVERSHGLPSPVMHGPGKGLNKYFFYPGFSAKTGGLLREASFAERRLLWDASASIDWLKSLGIVWREEQLISLFCYEPPELSALLQLLADAPQATLLLVTTGKAQTAVNNAWTTLGWPLFQPHATAQDRKHGNLTVNYLPSLTQQSYDQLLWTCDVNFVRGEDSLVRALWAGKPFIWHIYPQDDCAHQEKLDAFLNQIDAPEFVRKMHLRWNDAPSTHETSFQDDWHPVNTRSAWHAFTTGLQARLSALPDLSTRLMQFAEKRR